MSPGRWLISPRGYVHPAVGVTLAVVDGIVPLIVAAILLGAILRGSNETYERVFRLLRWLKSQPEPQAPITHGRHSPSR